ncbi:hypothetical protein SAMN05444156_0531 [Verrucomicrobium sp. GAS474]|uniref:hypothetical protein n=1 Tax=Verrucomicrobium sp. GAS474 TaxID=1882831 RepID=UPI000879394B|nr:hypothetical protein [Verrucomicrobium sp. GAS474]SDT89682.1 hypothetical protein SAMN05444156_0531 [Verrucomicrobium sp. GAS474]
MSDPANPNASALYIRTVLKSSGAKATETALATIGADHGDEQLAVIVGELTPGEVSQILSASDYTKPSIATHFITAEQLLGVLERIGGEWGSLKGSTINVLVSLRRDISDRLLPVVLLADAPQKAALLDGLLKNTLSRNLITALPLYETECPEFFTEFEPSAAQQGTWQELYAEIHHHSAAEFDKLKRAILGLLTKHGEGPGEEDEVLAETKESEAFLMRALQTLSDRAAKIVEANPEEKKAPGVFDRF